MKTYINILNVFLLPFTKVRSEIDQLQKDFLEKKLLKGIGLRICSFGQKIIENCSAKKKLVDFWVFATCCGWV